METSKKTMDRGVVLSTIWIFYLFNILYADVLNIIGEVPEASAVGAELVEAILTPEMLLGAAIFLETAMLMIVLSRFLTYKINRWINIIIGALHTLAVMGSLFVGTPTIFYIFFVVVEISTSLFIVWYAWTWTKPSGVLE